jgi:hypothetical protein
MWVWNAFDNNIRLQAHCGRHYLFVTSNLHSLAANGKYMTLPSDLIDVSLTIFILKKVNQL